MRFLFCGLFALVPSLAAAQGEQLLAPIPPGFTLGFTQEAEDASTFAQEFVPVGEDVTNWSQLLTIQIFRNAPGANPAAFHDNMQAQFAEACPTGQWHDVTNGVELGTPFDLMLSSCPDAPGAGGPETFISKAMGGRDAFYIVQGAWRGPLSREAVTYWTQYLSTVTVCDTRRADAPCPQ